MQQASDEAQGTAEVKMNDGANEVTAAAVQVLAVDSTPKAVGTSDPQEDHDLTSCPDAGSISQPGQDRDVDTSADGEGQAALTATEDQAVSRPVTMALLDEMSQSPNPPSVYYPHLLPFDHGWRRELVERNVSAVARIDVYYRAPVSNKKLRSMVDINRYLASHPNTPLTEKNFTFQKKMITAGNSNYESLRKASTPKTGLDVKVKRPSQLYKVNNSSSSGCSRRTQSKKRRPEQGQRVEATSRNTENTGATKMKTTGSISNRCSLESNGKGGFSMSRHDKYFARTKKWSGPLLGKRKSEAISSPIEAARVRDACVANALSWGVLPPLHSFIMDI